jgi:hypothetical protein
MRTRRRTRAERRNRERTADARALRQCPFRFRLARRGSPRAQAWADSVTLCVLRAMRGAPALRA